MIKSLLSIGFVISFTNITLADPPVRPPAPQNDPIPGVFCFRIMDMERIDLGDGTNNDFVIDFEVLNWTNRNAEGVFISLNSGTEALEGTIPHFYGAGIDQDGRGGDSGGRDIDASGVGLTRGSGNFDGPSVQSGRGRVGLGSFENDWYATGLGTAPLGPLQGLGTVVTWGDVATGEGVTPVPFRDLVGASAPGGITPTSLVPSLGTDSLGDTGIDGGPGLVTPDGSGNVLDGFTITIQDWDVGESLSFNWFLQGDDGAPIGTSNSGNDFGFGAMNLIRIPVDGELPGGLFQGNTGFRQDSTLFFNDVYSIPSDEVPSIAIAALNEGEETTPPLSTGAEFAAEFGAGITAPFLIPGNNNFNAPVNTTRTVPEPSSGLITVSLFSTLAGLRRRK